MTEKQAEALDNEKISTHTPLARRDVKPARYAFITINFYSHAPCEAWLKQNLFIMNGFLFLLTRPLRGVTALAMFQANLV